ncbi:MAG: DUF58 domain-containing protein [Calditrichia bacterium]
MNLRKKLFHILQFIPVQRNFWVLAGIMGLAIYWLNHYSGLPGDNARIRLLIGIVTLVFCGSVLLFSIATLFPNYGLFWLKKGILSNDESESKLTRIHFPSQKVQSGMVPVTVEATRVARPLLGNVLARILFEDIGVGEPLQLAEKFRGADGIKGRRATRKMRLPNIREYHIKGVLLHFEDFFRLFSLPYYEAANSQVITEPATLESASISISTEKADEAILKVHQHKKARGELFDYKKYAPGDDIRRILWKNYARTRELTVRIPDRNLPFVSHINLLVSFYDGSGSQDIELKNYLLDMYKEKIRQIADSILDQEFTVQLFTDQSSGHPLTEYNAILRGVSASSWQAGIPPREFLRSNSHRLRGAANILVLSSLCPVSEYDELGSAQRDYNLCYFDMVRPLNERTGPPLWKKLFMVDIYEPFEQARRTLQARRVQNYIAENGDEIAKRLEKTRAITV